MNPDRPLVDTESTLEYLLNTLCRAFEMKPKQAAALLTNNNQFLIHSIVKGIKGRYEPLIGWYQDIYINAKALLSMLEQEIEILGNSTNFQKVLSTMSAGLYSNNLEVCRACYKLMIKFGQEFGMNQILYDNSL